MRPNYLVIQKYNKLFFIYNNIYFNESVYMSVCPLCLIHGRICGPIRTKEKAIAEVAESF